MLWFIAYNYKSEGRTIFALSKASAIKKGLRMALEDVSIEECKENEIEPLELFDVYPSSLGEYFQLKWEDRIVPFIEDKILKKYRKRG